MCTLLDKIWYLLLLDIYGRGYPSWRMFIVLDFTSIKSQVYGIDILWQYVGWRERKT